MRRELDVTVKVEWLGRATLATRTDNSVGYAVIFGYICVSSARAPCALVEDDRGIGRESAEACRSRACDKNCDCLLWCSQSAL